MNSPSNSSQFLKAFQSMTLYGTFLERDLPEDVFARVDFLANDEDERCGGRRLCVSLADVHGLLLDERGPEGLDHVAPHRGDDPVRPDAHKQQHLVKVGAAIHETGQRFRLRILGKPNATDRFHFVQNL